MEPNKGQPKRNEGSKEDRKKLGLSSQRPKIKVMKYHRNGGISVGPRGVHKNPINGEAKEGKVLNQSRS